MRVLVLDVCVTVHTSLVSRAGTAVHARTLCVCALVPDACHGTHCLVSTRGYSGVAMTTSGGIYVATSLILYHMKRGDTKVCAR